MCPVRCVTHLSGRTQLVREEQNRTSDAGVSCSRYEIGRARLFVSNCNVEIAKRISRAPDAARIAGGGGCGSERLRRVFMPQGVPAIYPRGNSCSSTPIPAVIPHNLVRDDRLAEALPGSR